MFDDVQKLCECTIEEISLIVKGKNRREKEIHKAENIRFGTVCACVFNQNRTKRNDKIWKWSDFFPERDYREPADNDDIQRKCLNFMKIYNGGDTK